MADDCRQDLDMQISAIVPVFELHESGTSLIEQYLEVLEETGKKFELVYVVDSAQEELIANLCDFAKTDSRLRVIQLAKSFGDAAALSAGFEFTTGEIILTLPAHHQVDAREIKRIIAGLNRCDVAVACRKRTSVGRFQLASFRRRLFHWLVLIATKERFTDMSCGVRALKRNVADELVNLRRPAPIFSCLSSQKRIQGLRDRGRRNIGETDSSSAWPPGVLGERLGHICLDILSKVYKETLFVSFGPIGTMIFLMGSGILTYLVMERTFFGVALARPTRANAFVTSGLYWDSRYLHWVYLES